MVTLYSCLLHLPSNPPLARFLSHLTHLASTSLNCSLVSACYLQTPPSNIFDISSTEGCGAAVLSVLSSLDTYGLAKYTLCVSRYPQASLNNSLASTFLNCSLFSACYLQTLPSNIFDIPYTEDSLAATFLNCSLFSACYIQTLPSNIFDISSTEDCGALVTNPGWVGAAESKAQESAIVSGVVLTDGHWMPQPAPRLCDARYGYVSFLCHILTESAAQPLTTLVTLTRPNRACWLCNCTSNLTRRFGDSKHGYVCAACPMTLDESAPFLAPHNHHLITSDERANSTLLNMTQSCFTSLAFAGPKLSCGIDVASTFLCLSSFDTHNLWKRFLFSCVLNRPTVADTITFWLPHLVSAFGRLALGDTISSQDGTWNKLQRQVKRAIPSFERQLKAITQTTWNNHASQRRGWAEFLLHLSIHSSVNPITWPAWCTFMDWAITNGHADRTKVQSAAVAFFCGLSADGKSLSHSDRHIFPNCTAEETHYAVIFNGHMTAVPWSQPFRPIGGVWSSMIDDHNQELASSSTPTIQSGLLFSPLMHGVLMGFTRSPATGGHYWSFDKGLRLPKPSVTPPGPYSGGALPRGSVASEAVPDSGTPFLNSDKILLAPTTSKPNPACYVKGPQQFCNTNIGLAEPWGERFKLPSSLSCGLVLMTQATGINAETFSSQILHSATNDPTRRTRLLDHSILLVQ